MKTKEHPKEVKDQIIEFPNFGIGFLNLMAKL